MYTDISITFIFLYKNFAVFYEVYTLTADRWICIGGGGKYATNNSIALTMNAL